MDCSRLRLSVPKVSMSAQEGVIHKYCINVIYGKLEWDIHHRFSEFHSLNDTLQGMCNIQALPPPPRKSVIRPHDASTLEERRIMLQNWIRLLCARPDVRTSSPFLEFIEFERHTNVSVQPLAPFLCGACDDAKFQLSDFIWCQDTRSIVASYEETAGMARVGKVWSLVEAEELGSLSVWNINEQDVGSLSSALYDEQRLLNPYRPSLALNDPLPSSRDFKELELDRTVHMSAPYRFHCIFFYPPQNRLFAGLDTGVVQVYNMPFSTGDYSCDAPTALHGFTKETDLPLHTEAILSLSGDDSGCGRFITTSFDKAIRVVNCSSLETISGGNLAKRMGFREQLVAAVLERAIDEETYFKSRMFIGTSAGNVFVYASQVNPPEYRTTISCKEPVGALELAGSNLLVAHKYTLSIYRVGRPGEETKAQLTAQLRPDLPTGRTIRSIAVSVSVPLLFLGHTRVITVWDCHEKVCVAAFKAHHGGVKRLCLIGDASRLRHQPPLHEAESNIMLLSAGGDGCLKVWELGPPPQYRFQLPVAENVPDSLSATNAAAQPSAKERPLDLPTAHGEALLRSGSLPDHGRQWKPDSISNPNALTSTVKNVSSNSYHEARYPSVPYSHNFYEEDDEESCFIPPDFTAAVPHRH